MVGEPRYRPDSCAGHCQAKCLCSIAQGPVASDQDCLLISEDLRGSQMNRVVTAKAMGLSENPGTS